MREDAWVITGRKVAGDIFLSWCADAVHGCIKMTKAQKREKVIVKGCV